MMHANKESATEYRGKAAEFLNGGDKERAMKCVLKAEQLFSTPEGERMLYNLYLWDTYWVYLLYMCLPVCYNMDMDSVLGVYELPV